MCGNCKIIKDLKQTKRKAEKKATNGDELVLDKVRTVEDNLDNGVRIVLYFTPYLTTNLISIKYS